MAMQAVTRSREQLDGSVGRFARVTKSRALGALFLLTTGACYHPVLIPTVAPSGAAPDNPQSEPRTTGSAGSGSSKQRQPQPRCAAYFLLVENALPRPVEIYEVQHTSERFVAYAQIGITELPMTESSQQFVAVSRGELMAASSATEHRPGDRVALQRGCRPV